MAFNRINIAILVFSWCLLKLIYISRIKFSISIILYFQYFPYFRYLDFYPDFGTVSVFVVTIFLGVCGLNIYNYCPPSLGVRKLIWLFGFLLTVFFIVCCWRCLLLVSLGIQLVVTQCHCVLCVAVAVMFWLNRFLFIFYTKLGNEF